MLTWRAPKDDEQRTAALLEGRNIADAARLQLNFDLSLPLKPQLELAKRQLQLEQRQRVRQEALALQRVSVLRDKWAGYLRLLDGVTAEGEGVDASAAQQMLAGGYLRLPWLPE